MTARYFSNKEGFIWNEQKIVTIWLKSATMVNHMQGLTRKEYPLLEREKWAERGCHKLQSHGLSLTEDLTEECFFLPLGLCYCHESECSHCGLLTLRFLFINFSTVKIFELYQYKNCTIENSLHLAEFALSLPPFSQKLFSQFQII